MKKLVLAYSGGLDTSYCVAYLTEQGYEVHALTVDTGGFDDAEIAEMEQRALSLGAKSYKRIDVTEAYYRDCLRYLVYGNCLRYQTYPMSVSAERMFQAITTAKYAVELGADGVAHGSTGAGNDQVRFDLAFELSGRELEIITPIRDLKLSRQAWPNVGCSGRKRRGRTVSMPGSGAPRWAGRRHSRVISRCRNPPGRYR